MQSQRQAWMHKLTSDAAQEVLLYMQLFCLPQDLAVHAALNDPLSASRN